MSVISITPEKCSPLLNRIATVYGMIQRTAAEIYGVASLEQKT
jgi:hypothetical protein